MLRLIAAFSIIAAVLKLCGVISWPWPAILAPAVVVAAFWFGLFFLGFTTVVAAAVALEIAKSRK